MSEAKNDSLVDAFTRDRERYEAFTENLSTLISNLMRAIGIENLAIEKRTKTVASLRSKVSRPHKVGKYNSLVDITDIVGIRIIVFYERDVGRVRQLIKGNFDVDEKNSVDKSKQLSPDRFGYLSDHYVVSHSSLRSGLTENLQFSGLKAEIQVRTAVQHAWAAIDRSLRYNNDDDIPDEVKRQLFRVSALLELADKEFMSIVERITGLRSEYSKAIDDGELDFKINKDSSQAFLIQSAVVAKVLNVADDARAC